MKQLFLILTLFASAILVAFPMACSNHVSPTVVALLATETNTPTKTGTSTPVNTATATATKTVTNTPTVTSTTTNTGTPSDTPTITPTSSSTDTPTDTATSTSTGTPTDTPTATLTPVTISVTGGFQYSTDGGTTALTQPVTVAVGQSVIWDSTNASIHPLYLDDAITCLVNAQVIAPAGSYAVTFTYAADYLVHCGNHGACTLDSACPAANCLGMAATIHAQ